MKKKFANAIIYQSELRNVFVDGKNFILGNRVIWGKFIKNDLLQKTLIYIGKEFTDDYNNDAEDTLVAIGIYHLANSYYIMKEPGYFHSRDEKKDRLY